MSGKMSLVVLRSWCDDPPKIKGIAPQDDERSVKLEPDHKGHFLAEEIQDPEHDPRFTPRGRTFSAGSKGHLSNGCGDNRHQNGTTPEPEEPLFIRRKNGHLEKNPANRFSFGGFGDSDHANSPSPTGGRSMSNLHLSPENGHTFRPDSVGTNSPDHQDGSSMEYTPPSSPVSGRYRNLGPELAATIPKRAIKSNWITGIKSRWMKSTTHPDSGRSILKSYSSSPSLIATSSAAEETPLFFNPLYRLCQQHQPTSIPHFKTGGSGSSGSTSGIVLEDDSSVGGDSRSRSSLSNPISFSPSPPPNVINASLRQQILCSSSRPNGLQKHNSLTDFSEEDIFCESVISARSPTGSSPHHGYNNRGAESRESYSPPPPHGIVDVDECVLVEVIRKPETPSYSKDGGNNARTGGVVGNKSEKRHSVGELELEPVLNNKFAGVKVEGNPGKVARIKENIKKFGRFGRANSEKILRFQTGDSKSEREKCKAVGSATSRKGRGNGSKLDDVGENSSILHEDQTPPVPTVRKRSKNSDIKVETATCSVVEAQNNQKRPSSVSPQPPPSESALITTTLLAKEIQSRENHFDVLVAYPEPNLSELVAKNNNDALTKTSLFSDIQPTLEDGPVSSLISDQDRSMPCHVQSVSTIDVETFVVHSGCSSPIVTPNLNQEEITSRESVDNVNEVKKLSVVLDNNNCEASHLSDADNPVKNSGNLDEMFRSRNKEATASVPVPIMYNNNIQSSVFKKLTNYSTPSMMSDNVDGQRFSHELPSKNIGPNFNGIASAQVPVQAINRHVTGFGKNNIYADSVNTEEDDRGSGSSESRSTDLEWHRSSTRASFRGFCETLLQDEKVTIQVPEVVEASISFDEDSSLDPDEERENSVDYISVADVKVSNSRKSDKFSSHGVNREPLPSCVISLDIGSRGSGYSYWVKDEDDYIRIGQVDSGSSCPKSHKLPSWVSVDSVDDLYMDGDDEDNENSATSPAFGYHALNRFLSEQTQSHLFWRWREHFNEGSTFPYTLESKANDEELQFTMKSAIKHYAKISLDQIASKRIGGLGKTIFAITIPANFDHRARQIVRDAAFGTGLVSKKDALALIEDPCAAGIFAYHAIKPKIAKRNNIGTSYVSIDIGGVYLHSSGYDFHEGKLHQILTPSSQPISDNPESFFESELTRIFTPSFILNYQTKYKAGWLKLMTEFDHSKNLYDPIQRGNYHIFVPSSFVDHFRRFTSMEVEDALESSDITWSKVGAFGIPYWKMERFLQPMMDFIKNHIINIVRNHNYEFLVLSGGRSGSRQLVDYLRNAVRDYSVDVIVPKEYNAAVLQGSTISLTNLSPRLIINSPFSIGVGVMTPFIEDQHPEEKRVRRDGKSWCADVWDSLITVGQELEMNNIVLKRSYVGAQPGQSLLILPLFQSPEEPKFVTEDSVRKCCEFKFNSDQRAWQEVELMIKCRPSELLIMAVDDGVTKNVVVLDFAL